MEQRCKKKKKSHDHHKRKAIEHKKRQQKFQEGSKNVSFITYDGTCGAVDKVFAFVQQFDAAFRGEHFTKSSKLRSMAMHLQKSTRPMVG